MILKRQEKDNKIKAMYKSSTILASVFETDTNTLTVIFTNGGQYKYANVTLTDYTRFETADSQGIVLNSHIKKYTFEKLAPVDPTAIIKEITDLSKVDDKATIEEKTKLMFDYMLKLTAGYIATNKVHTTTLAGLEKAIADYNKATQVAPAPQVVA